MYVNSPGGSVTAGNNNALLASTFLRYRFSYVFFLGSVLLILVSFTFLRYGYIRYYEAYPT